MSRKLINHSHDIKRLRNEGYEVEIIGGYLLVHSIPYVNAIKKVVLGTLVTNVSIANNQVTRPNTHVVHFSGEMPCNIDGTPIKQIQHQSRTSNLGGNIMVQHSFSNKPPNGYIDYYQKMMQYIKIISAPAQHFDKTITAKTFKVISLQEGESVFNYSDTNSSRADIDSINEKLSNLKIGIIGLGGTGAYVLDAVAKTFVKEIHLFDGDDFVQHNAFRSPIPPSLDQLNNHILKVDYYHENYSKMRKHIVPHQYYINELNLGSLNDLDFVFVCIDKSEVKKMIFKKLEDIGADFIDTGIGIERVDDTLVGIIRTTLSSKEKREHIWNRCIPFADDENEDYASNIQIAPLNALNASFAVIKWYKHYGVLSDFEKEYHSTYSINVNQLLSHESGA